MSEPVLRSSVKSLQKALTFPPWSERPFCLSALIVLACIWKLPLLGRLNGQDFNDRWNYILRALRAIIGLLTFGDSLLFRPRIGTKSSLCLDFTAIEDASFLKGPPVAKLFFMLIYCGVNLNYGDSSLSLSSDTSKLDPLLLERVSLTSSMREFCLSRRWTKRDSFTESSESY